MSKPDGEIAAGEAEAAEDTSPAVTSKRAAETVTLAVVLAFAALMCWDNWRTGIGWESTGPKAGYFPFYVGAILAAACLFGLLKEAFAPGPKKGFVSRNQFRRVMQVFAPTVAFVAATQWLGLYVASFLLIAGFMIFVGRLRAWVSVVTALVFTVGMFVTFEIAFDVIMPKGPIEHLIGY